MRIVVGILVAAILPLRVVSAQPRATVESLAASWSGRAKPLSCQLADTNWFTPMHQRYCVWRKGGVSWAKDELSGQGAEGAPLDLVTWTMNRADSAAVSTLRDSLQLALPKLGLVHYPCKDDSHRWQMPGLAVEFSRGYVEPNGNERVLIVAVRDTRALPKLDCRDVPDIPMSTLAPLRKGLH